MSADLDDLLADDADLDRALRELVPPMPRSIAWEGRQRDALLTFIETGAVPERAVAVIDQAEAAERDPDAGEADVIALGPERAARRPRTSVVIGLVAANLLLLAGLLTAPRWIGDESPAPVVTRPPVTQPLVTTPLATPPPSTPAQPSVPLPDRYPVVPDVDVDAGFYLPQNDADRPRRTTALVARVDAAGVLTDGILVEVTDTDQCPQLDCPVLDTVTVDGRDATLYQAGSSPGYDLRALVIPPGDGTPAVTLSGADPVAFVEASGGNPVHLLPDRSDGEIGVELPDLPEGYEVIIPPAPYVRGAMSAGLSIVLDGGAGRVSVIVQRNTDVLGAGRLGPIEPVDINGSNAWTYDLGQGSPVIWQVSATTWITVAGAPDQATAIDIARSIEFVDRATWESTYDVSLDNFIPPTELPAIPVATGSVTTPPTTAPTSFPTSSADDEVSCRVIGASPSNFDRRLEVDCGVEDGVRVGMPVTTPDGLIGKITEVTQTASVVMLVEDPSFFMPGTAADAGASGAVRGAGAGAAEITVIDAQAAARVLDGMVVVTAGGNDSLAPAGIPIGVISGPGTTASSFAIDTIDPPSEVGAVVAVILYVPAREG